jgi:hypothetical protein
MGNVEVQWEMLKFPYIRDHIDQSATISYTSTHFIACVNPKEGSKQLFMEKQNNFWPIIFSVVSLAPGHVHFREETRIYMNKEALGGYQFLWYFYRHGRLPLGISKCPL